MNERTLLIALTTVVLLGAGVAAVSWDEPEPDPGPTAAPDGPIATAEPAPSGPAETPVAPVVEPPPAPSMAPPQPRGTDGKTLVLQGQLSHAFIRRTVEPQKVHLQIDVDGSDLKPLRDVPNEIAIVVDRSGSMSGVKLADAKTAALSFIARLGDNDRVALVSYESRARVEVPFARLGDPGARQRLAAGVKGLRARGGTNILAALENARDLFGADPMGPRRIVLLSDGRAALRDQCETVAEQLRQRGIVTTSMGLGADYDEHMLTGIADHGGGNYYFIADARNLEPTFDKELATVNNALANNVTVRVELDPRVRLDNLTGFPYEVAGATFSVPLGTFWSKRNASILAELSVNGELTETTTLATIRLTYQDLVTEAPALHEVALSVAPTEEVAMVEDNLNGEVLVRYEKIENARAYDEAMAQFEVGNQAEAKKILEVRNTELRTRKATVLQRANYNGNKAGLLGGIDADVARNSDDARSLGNVAPTTASGRSYVKSKRAESRDMKMAF